MISPIAIEIFGLQIYWYGIVYAIGFMSSYFFIIHYSSRIGLKKENLENLYFYFMIFSVLGGRIFEILFYNLGYYLENPLKVFAVWQGGMSIHGGILFGFLTILYFAKKYKINPLKITDVFVVPVALFLAFGRLANFVNQELVGKITSSKIGMVFPLYDDNLRWPTQIFEGFKNLITFEILYSAFIFKTLKTGTLTAWFLILYNFGRFIIDFLREHDVSFGYISMGQVLSLIYAAAGIILLVKINKKTTT